MTTWRHAAAVTTGAASSTTVLLLPSESLHTGTTDSFSVTVAVADEDDDAASFIIILLFADFANIPSREDDEADGLSSINDLSSTTGTKLFQCSSTTSIITMPSMPTVMETSAEKIPLLSSSPKRELMAAWLVVTAPSNKAITLQTTCFHCFMFKNFKGVYTCVLRSKNVLRLDAKPENLALMK